MQIDPAVEWRRLTEQYRSMSDEELRELAQDFVNLTETAQQALRQEMRSRGLGEPESGESAQPRPASSEPQQAPLALRNAPWAGDPVDIAFDAIPARAPELVPDTPETHDEDNVEREYTWKTELCELETDDEAMQLHEVLKRAGIESWIRFDGVVYPFVPSARDAIRIGLGGFQFLVAADQLDRAREIAAKPIPQEIIDDSKIADAGIRGTQVPEVRIG